MQVPAGLTWSWSRFALGAVFALPGILVAPFSPTVGVALAVGVLPAAAYGLPARRSRRAILPLVGLLSAAGFLLGSLLTHLPVVAVVSLLLLSFLASLSTARWRVGRLLLALVLPMVGFGLSFPNTSTTGVLAAFVIAGSVYAWLVSLLWPERADPLPPAPKTARGSDLVAYGILLGLASATAATMGYVYGLEQVGWAAGTVLLVMRPVRGQVILRSVGRAASVFIGAIAAICFALSEPGGMLVGLLIALAVGAMGAMQESRWYVAPAFTTLIVLTLMLTTSSAAPGEQFIARTSETLLGIGLALAFGAAIPSLYAYLRVELARLRDRG
ncbi:hypothetical protein M2317_001562 [Microbacterium sp. ZKA21]|uniref:FUSC family protein n=1 Tax=Microbacterium sp. ZKA21 TaxID=3381694 RepID=UPI003D24EC55